MASPTGGDNPQGRAPGRPLGRPQTVGAADGGWLARLPQYCYVERWIQNRLVVDLGCEDGLGAEFLARRGARRVTGVDLDIEEARRRRRANLEFVSGDVISGRVGVPDGSAEVVLLLGLLSRCR